MTKKLAFLLLGLGILYLVGYRLWYGYFPPETPHKIIGRYLKDPIPSDWNIVYFTHAEGGWVGSPLLIAMVDVPSQDIEHAKALMHNVKPFANLDDLKRNTCFNKSEFARNIKLSGSLTSSSTGFFECYLEEKTMKAEGDSVITRIATSNTAVLDVENKRLILGMF
jgi:hypothetical protein